MAILVTNATVARSEEIDMAANSELKLTVQTIRDIDPTATVMKKSLPLAA